MALRLIEMVIADAQATDLESLLQDQPVLDFHTQPLSDERSLIKVLLSVENTEALLNLLEKRFGQNSDFRVVLLPVEATLPRPEPTDQQQEASTAPATEDDANAEKQVERISREELYTDILDTTQLTRVFVVMVVLSTIVAAAGMLRNNVAVIVAAMVIAPLLGPNVALAFATTLGDLQLGRKESCALPY